MTSAPKSLFKSIRVTRVKETCILPSLLMRKMKNLIKTSNFFLCHELLFNVGSFMTLHYVYEELNTTLVQFYLGNFQLVHKLWGFDSL